MFLLKIGNRDLREREKLFSYLRTLKEMLSYLQYPSLVVFERGVSA